MSIVAILTDKPFWGDSDWRRTGTILTGLQKSLGFLIKSNPPVYFVVIFGFMDFDFFFFGGGGGLLEINISC